jgi:primosomal protein N' (replication factor Y)
MASTATVLLTADVAVDIPGVGTLSYQVGEGQVVHPWQLVQVSVRGRLHPGIVLAVEDRPAPSYQLLPIAQVLDVVLPDPLIAQARWAARYYRCHLGHLLLQVIPAAVFEGTSQRSEWMLERLPGRGIGLAKRLRAVYDLLPEGEVTRALAIRLARTTEATLAKLADVGAIRLWERLCSSQTIVPGRPERHAPTPEQAAAIAAILGPSAAERPFVLAGVTGSGKTLVYLEAAEQVVARGQQVLVLLPEIALTPQLAARFLARFPDLACWHSGLSDGERARSFRRALSGEARVILGARSAIWAPLPHLGLIIVDEEHDQSYKQSDTQPRYQARDVAVVAAQQRRIPVVLGTATPSLETFRNARQGRYEVLRLGQRPGGASMPTIDLVDMSALQKRLGRRLDLSPDLIDGVTLARERGEQAIILLNRRGWSPTVTCRDCTYTLQCRHCSVNLAFHRHSGLVRCHLCGHEERAPDRCPTCGCDDIIGHGVGTERLTALLEQQVPGLRVLRLDADTAGGRRHGDILAAFGRGEADCLVGTQMVAKGLDFPQVTLVGVVGADHALGAPDPRASERTFQLISQVAGRAGRGDRPGRVIVQARHVEEPAVACAVTLRHRDFYDQELARRTQIGYPPAGSLVRFVWSGEPQQVESASRTAARQLNAVRDTCTILGPEPAPIEVIGGRTRWHLIVQATGDQTRARIQAFLDRCESSRALRCHASVQLDVDVDPYDFA